MSNELIAQPASAQHKLLRQADAASLLNVSPRTLEGWRYRGEGPKYCILSAKCIRYRSVDLLSWLEARESGKISDTGDPAT